MGPKSVPPPCPLPEKAIWGGNFLSLFLIEVEIGKDADGEEIGAPEKQGVCAALAAAAAPAGGDMGMY